MSKTVDVEKGWCVATQENYDALVKRAKNSPESRFLNLKLGGKLYIYEGSIQQTELDVSAFSVKREEIVLNESGEFVVKGSEDDVCVRVDGISQMFFKPAMKHKFFEVMGCNVIGAIYQNEKWFGTSWDINTGICLQTDGFGYDDMDLKKVEWYHYENNFPEIVIDRIGQIRLALRFDEQSQRLIFDDGYSNVSNAWKILPRAKQYRIIEDNRA